MPKVKLEEKKIPKKDLKAVKPVVKAEKKLSTDKLTIDVYNVLGKKAGTIDLPKEIFGSEVNNALMSQAVRVYLANQRQGNASTKTRGEVEGSSRKIYRQKGTGRARHGSIRAPIFVKGGIVFGPKPRDFGLKLPKKMRKKAVVSALSSKFRDGEVSVISGLEKIEPKTKIMAQLMRTISKNTKQKSLLVTSVDSKGGIDNVLRAAKNIKNLEILPDRMLNTYEVLNNKQIFFMKQAIDSLGKNILEK